GLSCSFSPEQQFTRGADAGKPNLYGQPGGILASSTPPTTGQAGYAGTAGTNATGVPSLDGGMLFFGASTAGKEDGSPGYGGPGGGGGGPYSTCVQFGGKSYDVIGGGGGTGGCPGWGGLPGTSGGGAVAVLVRRGTAAVRASRMATGFAGTGGDGGLGGSGGDGGKGALPQIWRGCHGGTRVTMPATCPPDPTPFNCAAYGAAGGKGGDGGRGGGGAGGWTIGVLTVGEATAEVDGTTQLSLGKPGTGGMGGLARAPDGQKAPRHHIKL
ncbi:MAG: hypothetical protein MUF54_16480, partial [Polyangiaceae bacterium]|nr:hypothetical protein [Polyangiaceae bacterium]